MSIWWVLRRRGCVGGTLGVDVAIDTQWIDDRTGEHEAAAMAAFELSVEHGQSKAAFDGGANCWPPMGKSKALAQIP